MYKNYKVIKEEPIKALEGQGILLEHVKTGARIFVIHNKDHNKVFNITFRTPPTDDTGLPHILEHSVLCGSRKFPVKDPFVELAKGSLNTFLNAMTYPDKTMYPVASVNDKDFANLMDVYLDAVFYPNIYKDPRILQQEGWHYELSEIDGEVTYNGVVYNEMKGASSSPEQVLFRQIQAVLFPNHPYGYDSGGEPGAIPALTRQQFLDFHKKYYHPSNSFIYLYGDIDVEKKLAWLDEAYLDQFSPIDIDSRLKTVPAFTEKHFEQRPYAISSNSDTKNKTYLSYNVAFNQPKEYCEVLALEILEYVLLEAPGAVLKERLLALDIAEDIFGSYDSGLNQPTFSIVAKNANPEDEGIFIETIESVLEELAREGIDQRKIEAAINYFEFKIREADFGQYPSGVIYSIKALDTWLYDRDPFINFDYDTAFVQLREKVKEGYLQSLIKSYLLNNNHCAILQLVPDSKLLATKEKEIKENLKAYKETLSEEEKRQLIESTKALKVFQETPNTPEELRAIPQLTIGDIEKKSASIEYEFTEKNGVTYILHKTFTNNIVYGKLLFDFSEITFEEIPYVSLLGKLLTKINTKTHSYSELSDEINIYTGGINAGVSVYGINNNPNECQLRLEVSFKCFEQKINETLSLVEEIVKTTIFDDAKRVYDLICEKRSRMAMGLIGSGHSAAMTRSMSYHSLVGKYKDALDGIEFYEFLEGIESVEEVKNILTKIKTVGAKVLVKDQLTLLLNTEEKFMEPCIDRVDLMLDHLSEKTDQDVPEETIRFTPKNEGFKTSSKVQYNALTGDYVAEGYRYSGHMKVLQTIMSLDYMWTEVRVKGGAYGGFGGFRRSGIFYLGSYRDPNLTETYRLFKQLPAYIRALDLKEREITKYIIGTISQLDTPMTPSMKGEKALNMFMSDITKEAIQQERNEVIGTGINEIRSLAEVVEKVIGQNNRCVIGNESVIEEEKSELSVVKELFK